jgi:hypothetical protein
MDDSKYQLRWPRIGAVAAVVVLVGLLVWILAGGDDEDSTIPLAQGTPPAATSEAELLAISGQAGHPVYWAGDIEGTQLEEHRSAAGELFLRYLPDDTEIGDPRQDYLTIGTYPVVDAYEVLQRQAEQPGSLTGHTPDGGFVLTNEANLTSVYIAYQAQDLEIEVYDPDPKRAFKLATSGEIVPVG